MLWRRLLTIPGYLLAWAIWLAAAPLWLIGAAALDLVRRRRGVALRCSLCVAVYLTCEVIGIVVCGALWAWKSVFRVDPEVWAELHFRLEAWWGSTLFGACVRLFGLRLEVEGDANLAPGPYVLLLRHASLADTLLASGLVSRRHGIRLRYVFKQELLWDPCLDIVGNRLPNAFIDRFSGDSAHEVRRMQQLALDLGPRDGILIYPEGTRFTEARRSRILERLRQQGDAKMVDYASSLRFLLPPRPGGTLGILDAAPEVDVVVCAHTGFEGARSIAEIWQGALVHRAVRVQFRRIGREAIPRGRQDRIDWLLEEWRRIDGWIQSQQASGLSPAVSEERAAPRA